MITRSSIAYEDFLGSSIASQVMPPWEEVMKRRAGREWSFRFCILPGLDISTAFIFQKVGRQCCFHPKGEMIRRILRGAPASIFNF